MILAAALSLMFATKEVAFIYTAILGAFLVFLFFARLSIPSWNDPVWRSLVFTIIGLVFIVVLVMTLFMISLGLFDLFPVQFRDCGQAPVPGTVPGEMTCTESECQLIQDRCQRPIPVVAGDTVAQFDESGIRIAIGLSRFEMLLIVILIGIFTVLTAIAVYALLRRYMPFKAGERPALDLVLFIGSFTLPSLSPVAINGLSRIVSRLLYGINVSFSAMDYSEAGLLRSAGFVFVTLAVSVAVGLWWDRRRWLVAAIIFYAIFIVLFTTVFTNGNGLASGVVGSLSYWLEQQDVQRGSQPWYYYGLLVPLYEYLPLIGFLALIVYILIRGLRSNSTTTVQVSDDDKDPEENHLDDAVEMEQSAVSIETLFVLFLINWTLLTWLAYSFAGEKMPWLTTHFVVPLAMATGWIMGKLIDAVEWRTIWRRGGWVLFLVAPVALAALVQTISPWLTAPASSRPFSGYGIGQLNTTMQFLSALLVLSGMAAALYWVRQRIGWSSIGRILATVAFVILAILTIRTAWLFAYVNYDYASEFLVYAHSTPDVREVMEQIEDISRRTSGDRALDIAYTADGSYPFIWYLRNYPNAVQLPNPPSRPDLDKSVIVAGDGEWSDIEPYIGDNFACNSYNFLWWPMQDYYNLTWDRIRYAIANPEMRSAVWDIIFRRDYRKYEQATGKTVNLSSWPLRDGFRFCVRRDVVAQVWSESSGPVSAMPDVEPTVPEMPDYAELERSIAADLVISELGPFGNLNAPHGMAIDADGFLYVADSNNHRIVKLSPEGQVVDTWDSTWWQGVQWKPGCLDESDRPLALIDGEFCEPWGISVGPDNRIYVADTWNHRIQVFSNSGEFLAKFGVFGQSGGSVSSAPAQFYGPRDVVVDDQGYIYVTDTGNKRVQVFDSDFNFQRSFGGPGIIEGRLEEPVGLAIGPDDLLYIVDTWNTRMQVFTLDGLYVREWPIAGWEGQSVVNKPYVAVDSQGRVYVSDPEASRILVFDGEGSALAVLGSRGSSLFQLPTGVLIDQQDDLWVSDAVNQRILRFPTDDLEP
jgi:uncharacterized protein (TIGR03663 family)